MTYFSCPDTCDLLTFLWKCPLVNILKMKNTNIFILFLYLFALKHPLIMTLTNKGSAFTPVRTRGGNLPWHDLINATYAETASLHSADNGGFTRHPPLSAEWREVETAEAHYDLCFSLCSWICSCLLAQIQVFVVFHLELKGFVVV